jgi:KTSC domain
MPRVDLNSTLLPAATYQDQSIFLELEFRSGAIYRYLAVPAQTYQELLRAESQGRYFNQHIGIASPTSKPIPRAAGQLAIPPSIRAPRNLPR